MSYSQTNPPTCTKFGANPCSRLTASPDFLIYDPLPPPNAPWGIEGRLAGLDIRPVDAVARGPVENLLAPPKNLLAPSPKPNLCDEKNICVNVQFEQCIIKIHD